MSKRKINFNRAACRPNPVRVSLRALAFVMLAILTVSGCGSGEKTNAADATRGGKAGTAAAAESRPAEVSVAQATERDVPSFLEVTGSLAAHETSEVAPEVSGQVIATPVDVGAFVGANSVIARLDDRDAQLRLQQAQSGVAQAQADLRQTQARLGLAAGDRFEASSIPEARAARAALDSAEASARLAETNARRYAVLVETGDVSRSVYDNARTRRDRASAGQQRATAV